VNLHCCAIHCTLGVRMMCPQASAYCTLGHPISCCVQDPLARAISDSPELAQMIHETVQFATSGPEEAGSALAKKTFKHLYEGSTRYGMHPCHSVSIVLPHQQSQAVGCWTPDCAAWTAHHAPVVSDDCHPAAMFSCQPNPIHPSAVPNACQSGYLFCYADYIS
jgi:hypothetical protein